ncbi:MAG: histone deacetylase family protein [Gammaproteobacteria bacterium]|jgi:acetoin utilization deacetylase AcuC-like enzyme|nr:histone deacetylase family protein [Gammaproteobacteria bacterium]
MFRIHRVYDDTTATNRRLLLKVQDMLRAQFPDLTDDEVAAMSTQVRDPLYHRFKTTLFVAEQKGAVQGFAVLLHLSDLDACVLDFISAGVGQTGGGIGGALYERVRDEALQLGACGVFLECRPDDPALEPDPAVRAENEARLRFYERYGARPIINTAYETPWPVDDESYHLVFDGLGADVPLHPGPLRKIVRAFLERKYRGDCPADYVRKVCRSIVDDPVQLRAPRYVRQPRSAITKRSPRLKGIAMVINTRHDIHHVRERGYVEAPVRVRVINDELQRTGLFEMQKVRRYPRRHILAVHDAGMVNYLKRAGEVVGPDTAVYPYTFPSRRLARPPKSLPLRGGYYCLDSFTPINSNAYEAAIAAVDCTLTAADCILDRHHLAYALVRPPGHHAERSFFGGFCYFNSAAIAANYLSAYGQVALLDVDYHHGNGSQDIFYARADVLTVSLHADPETTYPYFSGFARERGEGAGMGFNVNLPLSEGIDGVRYREVLARALRRIRRFNPRFLVVSLGLDTAKADPTGTFLLGAHDFEANGFMIGALGLPVLLVQEGGYRTRTLGRNARRFFKGLWDGYAQTRPARNV